MKKIKKKNRKKSKMLKERQINKTATIQNILDWANRSIGHSIDIEKFNTAMILSNWEKTLVAVAKQCQVEIVYK